MSRNALVWIVVIVAISVMLVAAPYLARRAGLAKSPSRQAEIKGQPAPEFALESLDGKTVRLSDFRGKAVLVNFWATWCQPCKIEMPWFEEMQKQYGPNGLFANPPESWRFFTVSGFNIAKGKRVDLTLVLKSE